MNFLIDQLRGVKKFEATRVNFSPKNSKIYEKLRVMQSLKVLRLRECKITDEQMDIIIKNIRDSPVETLDVSFNSIRKPKTLKLLFNEYNIKNLFLNRNQMGIEHIKDILVYAQYSQSLRILDLSGNGYAYDHCKGCWEVELFKLLKNNFRLEEIYLLDCAFEFKNVDKIYEFMNRIFDSRYCSELREFHISYFCQEQSKQNLWEEKFKIFENFGKELWTTTKSFDASLVQSTSGKYDIRFLKENTNDVEFKSIKLEMISKNGLKKPINFTATKYFTSRNKKIQSYMSYIKQKQKENIQTETPKVKPQVKKRVRKATLKVKKEKLIRMI
jgi:hypothetical protein